MGATEDRQTEQRAPAHLFGAFPAITAVGLAGLYAIGGLSRTSQLRDASVNVREAVALDPIQGFLVRGVNIALSEALLYLIVAAVLSSLAAWDLERTPSPPTPEETADPKKRREKLRNAARASLGAGLLIFALQFVSQPLLTALLVPASGVAVLAYLACRWVGVSNRTATAIAGAVLALLPIAIKAYLTPPPLSRLAVTTNSGRTERGEYIAHDRGFYYFAGRREEIRGVPDRSIRRISMKPRKSPQNAFDKSLIDLL